MGGVRIVSVAALVLVVAGCGGAAQPKQSAFHGLARGWESQASKIATAAAAGDDCGAKHLADSLRRQVIAAEHKVPLRLRSPLVIGVNALAARLTCPATVAKPPPKKPPPKHEHDHHDHGHHGHGGEGGGSDK